MERYYMTETEIDYSVLKEICGILKKGGVVVYPTDTTYGLGCNIFDQRALEKVYRIKGHKRGKPMSFILPNIDYISEYAYVSNSAFRIMNRLLPGPYTLVLEATRKVPKILQTKQKTVGIRIPDNSISLALVNLLGNPLISTTALNRESNMFIEPEEIEAELGDLIDVFIDSGAVVNEVSTVISLVNDEIKVLRKGKGYDNLLIKI